MSTKDKSRGRRYTASERARAMQIYREYGPTIASRRMGVPYETIRRWAKDAGETPPSMTPAEQSARSHAMATQRVSGKWAEVREAEADAAGDAARIARERLLDVLVTDDHQMLRAATDAYKTLIDKAEMLSGQATERIAIWAEGDLDRELRELVHSLEEQKRQQLPAPIIEAGITELTVEVVEEAIIVVDDEP